MELPFEFSEIVNYEKLYNLESRFNGYTYNPKTNSISLNLSNLTNANQNNIDEIVDILSEAESNSKDIKELKEEIDRLKLENENIKFQINKELDTNITPIKAGTSRTVELDDKGLSTFEKDNPDRMIRLVHGALGISTNGTNDFETIINADGINPKFLPNYTQIGTIKEDDSSDSSGTRSNGSALGDGSNVINNNTYINNPKIRYEDLPCKIFRNPDTKKVEKIEYYKDDVLEYIETFERDGDGKRVVNIVLEHISKEAETTTLIRNDEGKVEEVNVEYKNLDTESEYVGMK